MVIAKDGTTSHSGMDQRFSSYSVVSSRLPGGGYAVLNPITGAVDLVAEELGSALRSAFGDRTGSAPWVLDPARTSQIVASLPEDAREELAQRGHLTTLTVEEERLLVAEIARATHEVQAKRPQLMIVPTLDCNYRCTYCFERPLQNRLHVIDSPVSYSRGNVVMPESFLKPLFESMARIQQGAGDATGGEIILYGGEPLDARNRSVVVPIVAAGRAAGFTFAAITNGHDLLEYIEVVGRQGIQTLQVSIDGPKRIHDRRRIHLGRESSFDRIVVNVRRCLEATDVELHLRVHLDPSNVEAFEEVIEFFHSEGWTDNPRVIIYANTVYEKTSSGGVRARIETGELGDRLRTIMRRHRNVFSSGPAVHGSRALADVFELGDRFHGRGTYCSANTGNYIFAPDGQIYACWESVGKECSRIGSYTGPEGLVFDERARKKWFSRSVAEIPECLTCAYALVCGGGCAQYSEYNKGTLYKPYCDDFQRLFSDLIAEELDYFLTVGVQSEASTKEAFHAAR